MKICPSCGRENADSRDFCECGEYLRWEPTQHVEAVKPSGAGQDAGVADAPTEPAPPVGDPDVTLAPARAVSRPADPVGARGGSGDGGHVAATEAPPGAATLLLRLAEEESAATGPLEVSVKPGERVVVLGLIRNESGIVDNYDISVSGLPEGWWTVTPATAYLVPYGTSGNYEQELQIHLHPPRTPEAQAKAWPTEVVASSRAYETQVAGASVSVGVEAYEDVAAKLAPDRASGRLKARFKLTVRNRANAPAQVVLAAEDSDGECQFRFAEPAVVVEPGRGVEAPFTVLPPKQIWIGRPKDRPIRVTATPAGVDTPTPPLPATYRQKPWLPWWLAIVAPLVIAAVVLFLLLQPKQTVMPNLKKANSVFAAQKLLVPLGLKLAPAPAQVTSASAPPGSIVDQTPAAGTKVKKGTLVQVKVAVGSGKVNVPNVTGLTPVTADTTLRTAGLVLGTVSPQPPNPTGKILSQIPKGGTVAKGTPVAVFLKPPATAAAAKKGAAGAAGGAASGGASGGSGGAAGKAAAAAKALAIPAVAGGTVAAAAKLSQAGFVPQTIKQFSSAPAGTLIGTNPPTGKSLAPGSTVTLVVSAGFPQLAYDNGTAIKVVSGATGKPTATLPAAAQPQGEATWSPDGGQLVYVQGPASAGQLMRLAPNQKGAQPVALTGVDSVDRVPSFAPTNKASILAFVSGTGGKQLCFATLGPNTLNPDCTNHPGWSLGRQISWSTDGRALLVFGAQNGKKGSVFGLIEFVSNVAFSTHASDWGHGNVVTNITSPGHGVIGGAFSPKGKQIAVVSNIGTFAFHVVLAPRTDFTLSPPAKVTSIGACQVNWRSDGQALAVMNPQGPCAPSALGDISVVSLKQLDNPHTVATNAENPAWQPLSLGG